MSCHRVPDALIITLANYYVQHFTDASNDYKPLRSRQQKVRRIQRLCNQFKRQNEKAISIYHYRVIDPEPIAAVLIARKDMPNHLIIYDAIGSLSYHCEADPRWRSTATYRQLSAMRHNCVMSLRSYPKNGEGWIMDIPTKETPDA